jgi:hypothetical protein
MVKAKILFVFGVHFDPRFTKRIDAFLQMNFDVSVAYFERGKDIEPRLLYKIPAFKLGKIQSKAYFKRVIPLLFAFLKLRKILDAETDLYLASQDMLIPTLFLKKKNWYYEIADLRNFENPFASWVYSFCKGLHSGKSIR